MDAGVRGSSCCRRMPGSARPGTGSAAGPARLQRPLLRRQFRKLQLQRHHSVRRPLLLSIKPRLNRHRRRRLKAVAGGKLHGVVKSGNIPLPGVTVTAQNTLTGKRYSTTTDITGAWTMNIPQNGRYVIRTQFAAFAQGSQEAVLNATSHDQLVNFQLILASREAEQEAAQAQQTQQAGEATAIARVEHKERASWQAMGQRA